MQREFESLRDLTEHLAEKLWETPKGIMKFAVDFVMRYIPTSKYTTYVYIWNSSFIRF